MTITLYALVNTTLSKMVFGRIFFVVTTLICVALGCHSKVNQKLNRRKYFVVI